MTENILVAALGPIVSRVVTSHCWKKADGKLSHMKAPLTAAKLAHHVNGGPAYGAAQIQPGTNTTLIALLDLDSHKGETPWHEMQSTALRIMDACRQFGGECIPFRSSGGNGLHLYLLWDTPQDAYSVRYGLKTVLEMCGLRDGTAGLVAGEVEIFPKQNSVPVDGFGNMAVLPLAGMSVPLDAFELDDMPKEYTAEMDWPVSRLWPYVERETPVAPVVGDVSVELATLKSALDAIPNSATDELDYDAWRNVIFALHHATQGSDEGLALAHEFSARSSKYAPAFLEERVWPFAGKSDDAYRAPITGRSILFLARDAYGWQEDVSDDFEVVPVDPEAPPARNRPVYRRDGKGNIEAVIENVVKALADPDECGVHIRYDEFRAEIMLSVNNTSEWRSLTDADYTRLQIRLEQQFKKISKEMMRDAVWLVADDNRFDSAIEWIGTLKWDGVPRIESFLTQYMGVADSAYTRAVSRYMWSAMAGRVCEPGCEAPMAPVFIGAQGAGKTRAVKALAPALDFYTELNLADRDVETSRRMRGRLVVELGELRGLHTRDADSIKAFISRTDEEWRTLYKEFNTTFARRFIFFGTTNQHEFLADETGERRWLPVLVGACDPAAVSRDCLQLWAEGREVFELAGVDWRDAETLAKAVHADHKISDAWLPIVSAWLETPDEFGGESDMPATRDFLRTHEVLIGALRFESKAIAKREEMRIGKVLQSLDYVRVRQSINKKQQWVWARRELFDLGHLYSKDVLPRTHTP